MNENHLPQSEQKDPRPLTWTKEQINRLRSAPSATQEQINRINAMIEARRPGATKGNFGIKSLGDNQTAVNITVGSLNPPHDTPQ